MEQPDDRVSSDAAVPFAVVAGAPTSVDIGASCKMHNKVVVMTLVAAAAVAAAAVAADEAVAAAGQSPSVVAVVEASVEN